MAHAKLSPSSSGRWLTCPASPLMEDGKPNTTNSFAAEGTAAHYLAEQSLSFGHTTPAERVGESILVFDNGDCCFEQDRKEWMPKDVFAKFEITQDMAAYVQVYIDLVDDLLASTQGDLFVEERLSLTPLTGEEGAGGTADAVILTDDEIIIVDLKYGQGLKVDAENNTQLMIYGLAALEEYSLIGDFKRVRLIISQPRLHHVSEWVVDIDTLDAFAKRVTNTTKLINSLDVTSDLTELFAPSTSACRYCKANTECQALAEHNIKLVSDDFETLDGAYTVSDAKYDSDTLAKVYGQIDLLKDWIKAVEQGTYAKLINGESVGDLKLAEGRGGARKWSDANEAETTLKSMRLKVDEMYDKKIISPTTAEKLAKAGTLGDMQWEKLQALIVRPEGKPSIAPGSSPKPAINLNPVEDFDDITNV
ncbi:DUF2800 domain-containing protein [Psychrobacter celer]|uniref:DUF2800 domain-containing protein n=1 Tax=Psychrobacter celer TaxID=306572 RepID=UPI003FD681BC